MQGEIMGRQLYTTKGFLYLQTYPSNYWVEYCWGGPGELSTSSGVGVRGTDLWILSRFHRGNYTLFQDVKGHAVPGGQSPTTRPLLGPVLTRLPAAVCSRMRWRAPLPPLPGGD